MNDAVRVDVVKRFGNADRYMHRALGRQLLLFDQNLAKQAAFHPLHHHIDAAVAVGWKYLHHVRMVQRRADILLALEAVEQYRIALHLRMGDFDRNRCTCIDVDAPID